MAKTPNGIGQFSGRVGGIVYAVRSGQQIVRAYQPIVTNPKSSAQSIQRAKANLVGRISKITPYQVLEGLGKNKSQRRSRFLRLLLRKVTAGPAAGDPSTFNAKLLDSDFVFAEGALIPFYDITAVTVAATAVNVTLSRASGISAEIAASQGVLVVAIIKQSSGVFEEVTYRFVSPDELTTGSVAIQMRHRQEGAFEAAVFMAPFGTADGSRLPTVAGDLTSTSNSLDAMLEVGTGVSSIVWGASAFSRNISFTPGS